MKHQCKPAVVALNLRGNLTAISFYRGLIYKMKKGVGDPAIRRVLYSTTLDVIVHVDHHSCSIAHHVIDQDILGVIDMSAIRLLAGTLCRLQWG